MTPVHGQVAPRFEAVRDAFAANFAHQNETGAALCVYQHGRPVVDLWGGIADPDSGTPWQSDTLTYVFSTTKGITSTCAHLLVQRGLLDLDAPVADYWPEFAAESKAEIPVRSLLSHRAGLASLDTPVPLAAALDWHPMITALAAQRPAWTPGTAHGYHAQTFGWLVGEVVRRITGRTVGAFLTAEIAEPLALDFHIGLPASHEPRVCRLILPPPATDPNDAPTLRRASAVTTPPIDPNDAKVHAAEIPSSNGIGTARAIARLYAALIGEVDTMRVLGAATLATALRPQSEGGDLTLGFPTRFALGYALPSEAFPLLGPGSFGHGGRGGSVGCAHPPTGITVGYVMNRLSHGVQTDTRFATLAAAIKACL